MEFGIFDHVEVRDGPLAAVYEDRLKILRIADGGGFYAYHPAEHHGTPLSACPSPSVLLAATAMATTRIRLGPLCYILPLYDPLRLIEEICMLDQLSGGRLDIGVGRGTSPFELGFFGADPKTSRAEFEENLEILELGLSGDVLSYSGRSHHYDEVPMVLRPVQQPHPPIWYPTSGPDNVAWAAKRGYNTVFLGPSERVAELVRIYEDNVESEELRRKTKVGVLRVVFVAENDDEAHRVFTGVYERHLENLSHLRRRYGQSAAAGSPEARPGLGERMPPDLAEAVAEGWAAVGSPQTVAEQLAAVESATGCDYVVYNPLLADIAFSAAERSTRLFVDEVIPLLSTPR